MDWLDSVNGQLTTSDRLRVSVRCSPLRSAKLRLEICWSARVMAGPSQCLLCSAAIPNDLLWRDCGRGYGTPKRVRYVAWRDASINSPSHELAISPGLNIPADRIVLTLGQREISQWQCGPSISALTDVNKRPVLLNAIWSLKTFIGPTSIAITSKWRSLRAKVATSVGMRNGEVW